MIETIKTTIEINEIIRDSKKCGIAIELITDGYHTFEELYNHRMILFATVLKNNKERAWKSKLHHDGTMFDDYFIVGVTTPKGDFTYHYHINNWDTFDVEILERGKEWDGHEAKDIDRLLSL